MTNACNFAVLAPKEVKRRLDEGSAILVDVREPNEYAREHILGARLVPLAGVDVHDFDRERAGGKAVVFHCQTGRRTAANAARLIATGFKEVYVLEGGLNGWREAGLPSHLDRSQPIELQRQVQIGAGGLGLVGTVLGLTVSPWFFGIPLFVGAGLLFAGTTGYCGMALLLQRAPWNQTAQTAQ